MKFSKMASALCLASLVSTASATPWAEMEAPIYNFQSEMSQFNGNESAGELLYLHTQYTPGSNFYWNFTLDQTETGEKADAFYLVVNNGPNPKTSTTELAIIYGDLESNTLSVFGYDTSNGQTGLSNSFRNTENHIATFEDAFSIVDTQTTRQVQFGIDTVDINAANLSDDWQGVFFDEELGFWFHPVLNSNFSYNEEGVLTGFSRNGVGWYDTNSIATTIITCSDALGGCGGTGPGAEVPEPATVGLLLVGLAGLAARRKKMA